MNTPVAVTLRPRGTGVRGVTAGAAPAPAPDGFSWWGLAVLVAAVAFAARLAPVLRGGGLFGLGNYDDGVNFTAAVGLAHGLSPYRDFLFLHPPGSTIALFPFALLGRVIGDANGFAVARVAWMTLGTVNAVLVSRMLRGSGVRAALVGGLVYAVFPPAVYAEQSTLLEAPATVCLLAAVNLLTVRRPSQDLGPRTVLLAGVLVGVSAGVKIWGVVVVAAVVAWCAVAHGRRRSGALLVGALFGVTVVCLPFFVVAKGAMWRMVVSDQLGRGRTDVSMATRLKDILGLAPVDRSAAVTPLLAAAVLAGLVACVLAWRTRPGRLGVVVLAPVTALLLSTPSWFLHYAGLAAAPVAVVIGAAAGFGGRWREAGGRRTAAAVLLAAGLLAGYAVPVSQTSFGRRFPATELASAVRDSPGCITSDDPTTLIELNVLSRNIRRQCPFMVDLGGHSYDLWRDKNRTVSRHRNTAWQEHAVTYLASGDASIVTRFKAGSGFNTATAATVRSWPVSARSGKFTVRSPQL